MQQKGNDILMGYVKDLCEDITSRYTIAPEEFQSYNVKRGLRNSDGTGVLAGVTSIGSVRGYHMEDGEPVPMPGKLLYRGIDIMDIIRPHAQAGTFGFEEVCYLLLLGVLPTHSQMEQFDAVLSAARALPGNFTEDMIIKAPSRNIMNKLSRSVLALYSYDPNPDDLSVENMVRQSI
jgi:citrate synthase